MKPFQWNYSIGIMLLILFRVTPRDAYVAGISVAGLTLFFSIIHFAAALVAMAFGVAVSAIEKSIEKKK